MKWDRKTLFRTFERFLFYFASFHLIVIALYSLITKQYTHLHIGDILDLKFIFPNIEYTWGLEVVLLIVVVIVFLLTLRQVSKLSDKK